ncbi:hypothetical protein AtubIFM57258_005920 [Aspergillus tubingensis]|nr:hypothetical protein AtubIFM57258_005920 [Aspergillus tubingensis]
MFSRIQELITVAREKTIEEFTGEEILDEEAGDKARRRSPEADKLQMLYHLTDYKKLMRGVPRDAFRRGQLGLDAGAAPTYGLGDLLSLTVNRKCSHALDRVYALYALAPLARERYPPDYHKTVNQVNLETTSFILQHEANVNIFNDFDFCFDLPHNDQSLPSWVMEFIRTDQEWQTKMQEAFCTAMAPATALWEKVEGQLPTITDDLRTLRLWGRAVGVVSSHWELSSDAMECFGAVQVLARCINKEHNGSDDPFRLAETLISASYYYTGCSEFLSLDLFSDIMNKPVFNDTEDFRRTAGSYFSALFHSFGKLAGKSFFIIDNNFDNEMTEAGIGFADCEVRRGDFLIIPSGLAQVLVLRPILEQMDNEDGLCFKIIGRAFVGGIADREESVKGLLTNLLEMSPLRQFHIR